MSIKSELTKTASYLRSARRAIQGRGGQISDTAGFKDLPEAINSIPSGSSNSSLLTKIVDGSITEVAGEDLNGATKIRSRAFYECENLVSVEIPDSVTSIEAYGFGTCTNLENVMLPANVINIEANAFSNAKNIKAVYIKDIEMWCKASFGGTAANPLWFGSNLYINDELVTNIIFPNTVTTVGKYSFRGCISIESVTISEGVSGISNYAFENCVNLVRVIMPSTITNIATYAFNACSNCIEIDFTSAIAVPTLSNSNAFSNINASCQIKVPSALYDEWIVATNWAKIAQHIVAV